jgi:signal transduction histidine kinase
MLLLLVVVLVPTAGVLWFMSQAVRNERLAVRQKLEDAYRGQLLAVQRQLESDWQGKTDALTKADPNVPQTEVFSRLVGAGLADSVILYRGQGELAYPRSPWPLDSESDSETSEWADARTLETNQDPASAATAWAKIAEQSSDNNVASLALQAQARCLARAGKTDLAIQTLAVTLADTKYGRAVDPHGRLIAPDAQLRALQLMSDPTHPDYRRTVELLVQRLTDYSEIALPSSQRRFLMHELKTLLPDCPEFPTLAAEDLASDYLDADPLVPTPGLLMPADPLKDVWQWLSPDRTLLVLFQQQRVLAESRMLIQSQFDASDVTVRLLPPNTASSGQEVFLSVPAGMHLPDWRLALYLNGSDPFANAAKRQVATYLWTGGLVILAMAFLALLVARYVGRQIRIARLQNDLLATVSHEIKTPLSSMRVLADTLLAGNYRDQQQAREYIQLIARENTRLSHLIDNFLTSSRIRRNKATFAFASVNVEELVSEALAAARERLDAADCRLDVEIAPGLPALTGDTDALITVILNLLDNACKYTETDKHIVVRAYAADGNVCLEVQDNGVGLSRRSMKSIFKPFYQVDRTLARKAGGCGLGLSIVQFIVAAHKGTVTVNSQPGKGSTFTVKLPAAAPSRTTLR